MGIVLVIHVIVCVLLVISILMQAGKGGGLAESFASAEAMFGTQTNTFMVRMSTILATIFIITSLVLAYHSSRKEQSLMSKGHLPKASQPKTPAVAVTPKQPAAAVVEKKAAAVPAVPTPAAETAKPAAALPANVPANATKP